MIRPSNLGPPTNPARPRVRPGLLGAGLADYAPVRFLVVGASNTALSYGVFRAGLAWLPLPQGRAAAAQAIAYGAGILWSFAWNRRWTFRAAGPVAPSLAAFTASQLLLLAASSALLGLTVDVLALPPTPSWLAVMALITVLNYLTARNIVFRSRS